MTDTTDQTNGTPAADEVTADTTRAARLNNLLSSRAVGYPTQSMPLTIQPPATNLSLRNGEVVDMNSGEVIPTEGLAQPTAEQLVGTIHDDGRKHQRYLE